MGISLHLNALIGQYDIHFCLTKVYQINMEDTECDNVAIGIDLGTTFTCVSVFQHGKTEVIANSQGERITPSIIAYTNRDRLVGEKAEAQRGTDPKNVIYNAKRFIGRTYDDSVVQENKWRYPFKIEKKL